MTSFTHSIYCFYNLLFSFNVKFIFTAFLEDDQEEEEEHERLRLASFVAVASTPEIESHVLILLNVIDEYCETMRRDQEVYHRKLKITMNNQINANQKKKQNEIMKKEKKTSHYMTGTFEDISNEVTRDGPLLASASLFGLSLHVGIDSIIFTLLIAPVGISISRPWYVIS